MGYTLSTMKSLVELGYEIHAVHWDKKKLTPFDVKVVNGIRFYPRSNFDSTEILRLIETLNPKLIVVSGWMDKEYLKAAKSFKKNGGIVVTGIDNQYRGGIKQLFAGFLGKIGYFKKYFSHVWVPGTKQFEFAKLIGFNNDQIIFDLYSADLAIFDTAFQESLGEKTNNYPKRMLFVGRFAEVKGVLNLIEGWLSSKASDLGWELLIVGNGPLKEQIKFAKGVKVIDFMTTRELADLSKKCGCFILPSIKEPWGVVIHEFAAAGLPIICTKSVGASERFVIDQGNGIIIPNSSVDNIRYGIEKILRKTDKELCEMGVLSNALSNRITPLTSALNLVSIIK